MRYKCLKCEQEHSLDNVAPVCYQCYGRAKVAADDAVARDKKRLDFVERYAWSVELNTKADRPGKYRCFVGEDDDGYGATLRAAIDAAMRAEKYRAEHLRSTVGGRTAGLIKYLPLKHRRTRTEKP